MRGVLATIAAAALGIGALFLADLLFGSTFRSDPKTAPAKPASTIGPGAAGSPERNERRTERYGSATAAWAQPLSAPRRSTRSGCGRVSPRRSTRERASRRSSDSRL